MRIIKHAGHNGLRYTLMAQTQDEIDFLGYLETHRTIVALDHVLEPKDGPPKMVIGMEVHLGCASSGVARQR